jgi:hypothetical protein
MKDKINKVVDDLKQVSMKQITVQVPDGKDAVWQKVENVGQVLMLIDETNDAKIDDRPVTERIKTFEDAYNALGEVNPLCKHYDNMRYLEDEQLPGKDILAYLKLRIIAAALNEDWTPQFTKDERRYYPYFYLYTQQEIDEMSEDDKKELWLFGGSSYNGAYCGLAYATSNNAVWSTSASYLSARLAVKNYDLALYFGKQFIEIWSDYVRAG